MKGITLVKMQCTFVSLMLLCFTIRRVIALKSLCSTSSTLGNTRPLLKGERSGPLQLGMTGKPVERVSYRSPCKINLFLFITRRRPDKYHELASLFQTISLSDYLHFEALPASAQKDELTCSDTTLEVTDSNLVLKALRLMRERTGIRRYFKVHLDKHVPMQAGLGGGSGNAATAMFAFNQLCDGHVSETDLRHWASDIGSDISFFFSSGTAFCTGRGEQVQSLSPLLDAAKLSVEVFKPALGLSTAEVFRRLDLSLCSALSSETHNSTFSIPAMYRDKFQELGALQAARESLLVNDLEAPAFLAAPLLQSLKQQLLLSQQHSKTAGSVAGAMMSGSGSSVYALRPIYQEFKYSSLLQQFPGTRHFSCSFLQRPPDSASWY